MNPAPILDLIAARETAAGLAADHLREQISVLSQQLDTHDVELADLETTRTTLLRLAGHPDNTDSAERPTGPDYQQILTAFAAGQQSRAKDICAALGVGTTANDTERLRAKLKRMVARGVLTEDEPGLFALAPPHADLAHATVA